MTREEIYYLEKENIEGYACLVNFYMKSLYQSSQNPALINIDNQEAFNENSMKDGQLFYQSTLGFKDSFTSLLNKRLRHLKTINVKINFKSLSNHYDIANKMTANTFAYIGIKDTIVIN